ncbi:PTS system IIA component (Fru family) [Serratia fonticola]|uniref:PTS system IIA component (Fru family) n=1 Tax=Serratia fonticola TaxID=47917 RepID=A0A542BPX9_SERFO|nr:PTS sugar transporter subunit IIA [Serratia fonticola]TQI80631.1 PTS system IIA component (Fru family) [Serratia fonticola]TQI97344.1 PTS system IIA component (Fru family) [Serratia fonticola]TVZ71840.1 PTS system IIA component (Fru family) [Serratia fonticola]
MNGLINYFTNNAFTVSHQRCDWEQAIDLSMNPLLENNIIELRYVKAIKESTRLNGAYYILTPEVAMPHARPEEGALSTALTLTVLPEGVYFNEDNPQVKILIGLAAKNADCHINAIQLLSEMFCDDHAVEQLIQAKDASAIKEIILRF